MSIWAWDGIVPVVDPTAFVHPDATVMDQEEFEGALGGVIDNLLSLVTVLLLLAVLIFQRRIVAGLTAGAVKG